ncbi:aminopeptidase P family protein [Aquisediminimonas sediminicola]|uniref:aminopeptidase P family protein n=1 Tax=Alteraquisediminimonas sediminicola TaxID=2676787 RepID=UPI001C8D05C5|nr:aminopeptidase P family protein [Aquisediminimonas sediminicola]
MTDDADRLTQLRRELAARQLDGFVIPLSDEHMSEYVGGYAQRLAWLTGFGGSAGTAVVLADKAAIFIDGRYTLQVRDQVDGAFWSYQSVPETNVADYLKANAPMGAKIGYDAWLHSKSWVQSATSALATRNATLIAVPSNPVDTIWADRPAPSNAVIEPHPDHLAGQSASDKRNAIATWLADKQADVAILTALDSIAWAFNIRGRDVERTPVALAFAMIWADETADLFIAPDKLTDDIRTHLGAEVRLHPYAGFSDALSWLAGKTVAVDPDRAVAGIYNQLQAAGANIIESRDPVILPKAIKNAAEISGTKAAHRRDGAALSRFLHWLSVEGPKGQQTEMSASDRLEAFRQETGELVDLSFDTISGAGPNGAIVHYRVSETTNRPIACGTLYLVDSGGQYRDGTTDVTRTIAIGPVDAEMKRRFTLVLKGHIALARARFPKGTRGSQLDVLARQYLWAEGLDYAHGTGHGVGSFLSVHEGPQRIATGGGVDEPLAPGMIVSNEPGYYKTNGYGIRIENLVLVTPDQRAGEEKDMLAFDTLTLAPIDRHAIEPSLLNDQERQWLNHYHARVLTELGPVLDGDARVWLAGACAPL